MFNSVAGLKNTPPVTVVGAVEETVQLKLPFGI